MPKTASGYLTQADNALGERLSLSDTEKQHLAVAAAQVVAIQAVAAAIDRLASVVARAAGVD